MPAASWPLRSREDVPRELLAPALLAWLPVRLTGRITVVFLTKLCEINELLALVLSRGNETGACRTNISVRCSLFSCCRHAKRRKADKTTESKGAPHKPICRGKRSRTKENRCVSLPVPLAGRTSTFIAAMRTFTPTAAGRPPPRPLLRRARRPTLVPFLVKSLLLFALGRSFCFPLATPARRVSFPKAEALHCVQSGHGKSITRRPDLSDGRASQ